MAITFQLRLTALPFSLSRSSFCIIRFMKVAILGFGLQGRSNYQHYSKMGADITICDQNEQLADYPKEATIKLGSSYLKNLNNFDVLVRTPFLRPIDIQQANPDQPNILEKVTTASNEFLKTAKTPTIAVTGTKGKGSTCLIIEAICKVAGLQTTLLGNIGIPPLDMLKESQNVDLNIFEIASFQTMDLRHTAGTAVCLNIFPEHLDWHTDYQEYRNAKAQLFKLQKGVDRAIYALGDKHSREIASASPGQAISYNAVDPVADVYIKDGQLWAFGEIVAKSSDIQLPGRHNKQNICAAIAAVLSFKNSQQIKQAIPKALNKLTSLSSSRLETVRVFQGITFVDDSHSTTPQATMAALEAFPGSKIVIAGGHNKQVDLKPLARSLAISNIRHLVLIGDTAQILYSLTRPLNPRLSIALGCRDMSEIMSSVMQHAKKGDTVLLSPGCASFGLFNNYVDRSQQFKRAVNEL